MRIYDVLRAYTYLRLGYTLKLPITKSTSTWYKWFDTFEIDASYTPTNFYIYSFDMPLVESFQTAAVIIAIEPTLYNE